MSRQITIFKGDTEPLQFTITDTAGAVNLTGQKVFFTVKKKVSDPDNYAIIRKSWTSHTNAVGGITSYTLQPSDTFKNPGTYFWEIQLKGSGGAISTSSTGEFIIQPHLTYTTT